MLKKIVLSIFILFLLAYGVFAQTAQTITLKPGFNFISFTSVISMTPAQLKTQNQAVEDIYLFSAAAGSFLSANDGTLSTLAAGKGYIVKSSATSDTPLSISGDAIQTIGNINIKTGFNLIGFSKIPLTVTTFKSLMNVYTSIKGIYKWSPAAGSFIQVVRDNSGAVTLLDGADPSFKAGESYFFNMAEDTTINYDGTDIILGNGPPAPVAKTLEITGTVGASTTTAPSYSVARAIDLSTMQLSVYDEINNANVEGAVVTATGANTFKATLPVATADRYLSVLVKNSENKVIYKSFLGRVPKATEVTENTVKISNIKVSDESTARAIIVLENRAKIPVTAVIAKTSVDASIAKTDFALALEEHIAGLEDRVPELKLAVNLIANVLTTAGVDNAIKEKVTEFTFSESSKLLSSYVSLLQDANTLQTVNQITVPTQLTIGSKQITAQSTQVDIYETVVGINETIGQRVEMPVLTPPPGRYDNPISITMTCATPNANIVYDHGDGNPGITYTAPVSINKTCTLNVAGFRSDWPMSWHSKFVNATYTIGPGNGGETIETRVLSSITLDRTSEVIVATAEKYYLSNVKISAHYSNGDSKEVQATRWEMVSCPGSFSDSDNSYYLWSKTGDAIFNAVYSENGIEKKIEFKLMVRTQEDFDKLVPLQLTLSQTTDSVQIGGVYDLSKIIVTAHYGDGSTNTATPVWSIISGDGVINGNICNIGNTAGPIVFKCVFSAVGKTIENTSFTLSVAAQLFSSHASITPAAGGSLTLNNGVVFEVPSNSVAATTEVELATLANIETRLPTTGQTFYKLNTTGTINNATIKIPLNTASTIEENILLTCMDYTQKHVYRIKPTIKENYYLFTFGSSATTSNETSLNKNTAPADDFLITDDLICKSTGDTITSNGVTFTVYNDIIYDRDVLETGIKDEKIEWPHYRQYWNTCVATTWLMLLKGYKLKTTAKELNQNFDSIYTIFSLMKDEAKNHQDIVVDKRKGVNETNGDPYKTEVGSIVWRSAYLKADELTKKYNPEIPIIINNVCDNFNNLFYLVVKTIRAGKPLRVESFQHSILICGYQISDNPFNSYGDIDIEKVFFYVNNPGAGAKANPYAPMRLVSCKKFYDEIYPAYVNYFKLNYSGSKPAPQIVTNLDYVVSNWPFVCYYAADGFFYSSDNRYLQTIQLSDKVDYLINGNNITNIDEDGGIKLIDKSGNEIAHTAWDDTKLPPNEITWVQGNGKIELFDNIHFIKIPISNSSDSTNVSVKLSIYKENIDIFGKFVEPPIVHEDIIADNSTAKYISLDKNSIKLCDFTSNKVIVEKFVKSVQDNPSTDKFIFRVELYNAAAIIDRFDVKFQYTKPLFYIDPPEKDLRKGESFVFKSFYGDVSTGYKDVSNYTLWEASSGAISSSGQYKAPLIEGNYSISAILPGKVIQELNLYGSNQSGILPADISASSAIHIPVSNPVFSPVGGVYTLPIKVTISCDTPDATIKYTTDGSDPITSANAIEVFSPQIIEISRTTALKAIAFKNGIKNSELVSDKYTAGVGLILITIPEQLLIFPDSSEYIGASASSGGINLSVYEPTGGVVSSNGLYTAPKNEKIFYPNEYESFHVIAQSNIDPNVRKTMEVRVIRPILVENLNDWVTAPLRNDMNYERYFASYNAIMQKSNTTPADSSHNMLNFHGNFKGYFTYPSAVSVEGTYDNGNRINLWKFYRDNGELIEERNYSDGMRNGMTTEYFQGSGGKKYKYQNYFNDYISGLSITYYNDEYNNKMEEGEYTVLNDSYGKRSVRNGKWKLYAYLLNMPHIEANKYIVETTYANGLKEGPYCTYDTQGQMTSQTQYKNDKENGLSISYNNGIAIKEINYIDGKKNGLYIERDWNTGATIVNGNYINDKREGIWTMSDMNGKVYEIYEYVNDDVVKITFPPASYRQLNKK